MTEQKFTQIIGGTKKEAYSKFPWLEKARFRNAIIDISKGYLVWKDGKMWSNISQEFQKVEQVDNNFKEVEDEE